MSKTSTVNKIDPISEEEKPYEIPESWVWVRLGDAFKIINGGTPKSTEHQYFTEYDGIPWITPADLSNMKTQYVSRGKRLLTQKGYESCSAKILPKYSILYTSCQVPLFLDTIFS